jgi:Flp pilus assembly protein TadG
VRAVTRRDQGSVLVLVPALVLVLIILGAISVDAAVEYLGHRQLQDFASSAADQIAASALDRPRFYGSTGAGAAVLVPADAQAMAAAMEASADTGSLRDVQATAEVSPDGQTVTVVATAIVHDVFGPAVGGQRTVTIQARSSARIAEIIETSQ